MLWEGPGVTVGAAPAVDEGQLLQKNRKRTAGISAAARDLLISDKASDAG